ncbi:LOW QUALITY PROTEIN: E3 ubiquitin-protein ligase AMFR [Ixodes scapularis]|uniref:LOW QUALITY PROTEIN: E3 ubiquitin-protein ligase AMFR n=1 Tax=Ixodes scapularis TaxID=6945 RepID=UPI001A9E8CB8|nr:LOW QUALITY PROTEIN: E3 ubiquitin-protein ligase AMFR [Ixodes scapularis]
MPAVFLDRLPLPSLQAYTVISVLLLSGSVYYAVQVTSQLEWKINAAVNLDLSTDIDTTMTVGNLTFVSGHQLTLEQFLLEHHHYIRRLLEVMYFMFQEPLCVWTVINMAYCCLILIGKVIQKLVFGELRVSEQQHMKDKFWNFVFYKFIFIFGVMNVQYMDEVVLWCSWFSVLGFLHLLAQLCKDRFEYLSFSPTTPKLTHVRLLALLSGILLLSVGLFAVCVVVGLHAGANTFAFMAAECSLVTVRTLYVIVRYGIHLWDVHHEKVWENRAAYVYYAELCFELTALAIDFCHDLHMLLWGNIFLSMASLVILMQLRYLFYEIQRRVKKHKNYLRVVKHMEANYPMATADELEKNSDDCAICWTHMESARKLPCGHLFHNSCLRSWLEQDTSCPTCRMSLSEPGALDLAGELSRDEGRNTALLLGALGAQDDAPRHPQNTTTNHFFHFDGSRYVSWLPSFSVEVTHTNLLGGQPPPPVQTSQLDNMARQVQQMFPNMPLNTIMEDLRSTRSVELTIENILDERLVAPPTSLYQTTVPQSSLDRVYDSGSQNHGLDTRKEALADERFPRTPSASTTIDSSSSMLLEDAEPPFAAEEAIASGDSSMGPQVGGRFSKSPSERERMLSRRKEELLKMARKKFLDRAKGGPSYRSLSLRLASELSSMPLSQVAHRRLRQSHPQHLGS